MYVFFLFKQKTAYEMRISDGSSDVCSSDLAVQRCERYGIGLGLEYYWEGRGQLLLAFVEQLFIELFAGTQAHDLDLDIDIGLQSSEPDHPPCNVHDDRKSVV